MVLKADQERLKALLSETVLLLCKNGLEFKSDFCIEALIGITVDQDDVFLISIKETVENELRAAQRAKEEAEKLALEAAQSPAPESPSRTHRKRKRKSPRPQSPSQDKNIKLETSGDRELDNNTSNTSFQDYNDESQHSRNMKFESGGAGDMGGDDEDNSNEIVFVKTENTDDQSLYGGPGQSSFLDSPYQSGMDSSQMSSSFQSPGAHSSHPGTSSWQSPMDSSQQGMSQNPLETQQGGYHHARVYRKSKQYSKDQMNFGIDLVVNQGYSASKASKVAQVPRRTLQYQINKLKCQESVKAQLEKEHNALIGTDKTLQYEQNHSCDDSESESVQPILDNNTTKFDDTDKYVLELCQKDFPDST